MKKIIITAMNKEYVIGKDGDLPWHYPEDMEHFRKTTTNHPVIMGRKTYTSLPKNYKPLPNRTNIVLTRNPESLEEDKENLEISTSLKEAWSIAKETGSDKAFVIGGENVYRQTLDQVDELIISRIPEKVENADSFFPDFDEDKWTKTKTKKLDSIKVETWERD